MKKLLSLSDLYNFYVSQNKNVKFSSADSDSTIVVHINEPFRFEIQEDSELFLKTNIRFCHTEDNLNHSYISQDTMEAALPTVYNMPILGYIWEDEDGTAKFAGHEFYENENGETVYQEIPLGLIPESTELKFIEDKDNGKTYLEGTGLIWKTYSKASEILEREKDLSVSIEILVDELSFSAKDHTMILEKIRFTGVTILQADPEDGSEIKPGMSGAQISVADFSQQNNSVFAREDVKQIIQDSIREAFDNLNNSKGKEETSQMNHFEELLQKYGKTVEDITFEYDGLTDEKLDTKFAEAFDGEGEPSDGSDPEPEDDGGEQDSADGNGDGEDEPAEADNVATLSIVTNGAKKEFSVSLVDKLNTLYDLVNTTYGESDNDYYDVDAFDDDKVVLMHGWISGKTYRQSYAVKKDVYSLKGDRVQVYATYMTKDEQEQFENMKKNYSATTEKLSQYEAEPEKMEILNSEEYSAVAESEEFTTLKEQEAHFELSVDEVRAKADEILLQYAKAGKIEFAKKDDEKPKVGMKLLPVGTITTKRSRYGGLGKTQK